MAFGGVNPEGEDNGIKFLLFKGPILFHIGDEEVFCGMKFLDRRDGTSLVFNPIIGLCPFVISLVVLSHGPDIHVEEGDVEVGRAILRNHGLLGRIHAADGRTMILAAGGVPRSDALDEGNPLHLLPIRNPDRKPLGGTRGGEHPLELDARQDILIPAKPVLPLSLGQEGLKAKSEEDGPDPNRLLLLFLVKIDRPRTADLDTFPASGTGLGIDDQAVRDGLRKGKIDGLPFLQSSTEFPLHLHRTNLDTGLAEGATFRIDKPGLSKNRDPEISCLSLDS